MSLDGTTLHLMASTVAALLGAMLLHFARREDSAALRWWGFAYLLGAATVGLWIATSGALSETLSLALNGFGFVACAMVWNAARLFHGRAPVWAALGIGPVIWIAALIHLPPDAAALRIATGAAIIAVFAGLTSAELFSERRRELKRRLPAFVAPTMHGLMLILPVAAGLVLGSGEGPFASSIWVTLFSLEVILYAVATVITVLMLLSDRKAMVPPKTPASMDPLTALFNRRGFAEAAARMIDREAEAERPVTLMIFDLDQFKSINDRYGHPAGDEVLKLFGSVLANTLRMTDLTGRIGGEEFAALLPCSLSDAQIAADRVRENFAQCGLVGEDGPVSTTVSVGVAGGPAGTELEVLLAAADTALYQAKRGGRNRVVAAEEVPLSLESSRRRSAALPASKRPRTAPAMA